MSMYGDSPKGMCKNDLFDSINEFLETNSISELLQIVTDCIERKENK